MLHRAQPNAEVAGARGHISVGSLERLADDVALDSPARHTVRVRFAALSGLPGACFENPENPEDPVDTHEPGTVG